MCNVSIDKIQAILSSDHEILFLAVDTFKNSFPTLVEGEVWPFRCIICVIGKMLHDGPIFGTTWNSGQELLDKSVELLQQVFHMLFLFLNWR